MYIKVTPGNEAVGIQKHTLYVISYKLPWVLRPKNTIIRNSTVFLAFPHNSFWPVKSYETVIFTCWRNALEYGRQRARPNGQ